MPIIECGKPTGRQAGMGAESGNRGGMQVQKTCTVSDTSEKRLRQWGVKGWAGI